MQLTRSCTSLLPSLTHQLPLPGPDLQGAAAQKQLVEVAQQYMIRRTSETLKQYLPAKVQEASLQAWAGAHHQPRHTEWGATLKQGQRAQAPSIPVGPGTLLAALRMLPNPSCTQVIFCKMSGLQHALYKGFLESEPVAGEALKPSLL